MPIIVFQCHDCAGYNKHQRDAEGFEEKDTEFSSFSDAVRHAVQVDHWIDAIIRDGESE